MAISRRNFLKGTGLAAGALVVSNKPAQADVDSPELRTKGLQIHYHGLPLLRRRLRHDCPHQERQGR